MPRPLLLPPNPVWRSYRGGNVLRTFRGTPGTADDSFPEDWLASSVIARNGTQSRGANEGLSTVHWNGEPTLLPALAHLAPEYFPPATPGSLGYLLKLLDASDRLHLQAHPDDHFARTRLGGTHGKTECWYVLETRSSDAHIHLGFQRPPTRDRWRQLIETQDTAGLLACFDRIPVAPGDCFIIPAGVPHAIGAGIFLLEMQQPSDWVVRCEFTVGGHTLPEAARFMGLPLADCLEIFDYEPRSHDFFKQTSSVRQSTTDFREEEILAPQFHRFFRLRRFSGAGPTTLADHHPAVVVITAGSGTFTIGSETRSTRRGDALLLPSTDSAIRWSPASTDYEFLVVSPPATA